MRGQTRFLSIQPLSKIQSCYIRLQNTLAPNVLSAPLMPVAIPLWKKERKGERAKRLFLHLRSTYNGGRTATGRNAVDWAKEAQECGAGEILLTSMDRDGTKEGYDLELLKLLRESVSVPVIASGGVGKLEHLCEAVEIARVDAVLAASIFHFKEYSIPQVKAVMAERGIHVRQDI